ncbi:hypothetical protein LTR15_002457 [Elasticomyces elasticus]|nr:hypothetical protein LTR15_002457 [Elasticomyces elasticus]
MTAVDPRPSRRTRRPTASSPPSREKVPRYMKELYITMHGWDAAAAEVTTGSLGAYRGHLAGLDTLHAMKAAAEADTASDCVASKKVAGRELRKLYIDMKGWKPDDVLEYMRKTHSGEYALLEQVAGAFAIKCELSRGTDCAEGGASCEDVEMMDYRHGGLQAAISVGEESHFEAGLLEQVTSAHARRREEFYEARDASTGENLEIPDCN